MSRKVWFPDSPSPKSVKLPRALDRRYPLMPLQIEQIKELYKAGFSSRAIGTKFNVSKTTVLNYVNPKLRAKANARARKRNQYKWANDTEWKRKKRVSNLKSFKRKKSVLPEFRRVVHQYEWRRRARRRAEAATTPSMGRSRTNAKRRS